MYRQKLKSTTLQWQRHGNFHLKIDHCSHFANIPPCLHFTKLLRCTTTLDWKEHHQSKYIEFSGCRRNEYAIIITFVFWLTKARTTDRCNERAARAARSSTFLNQSND